MHPAPDSRGFAISAAPARGAFEGVAKVVRFNPEFFLGGAVALGLGMLALRVFRWPRWLSTAGWGALATGAAQYGAALGATHWIYDRSALHRWTWLPRALGGVAPARAVVAHSGFDEVSPALRAVLPGTAFRVLDLHDSDVMSEPSITRARRLHPPPAGTERADYRSWPVAHGTADAIFLLFAAHEWRQSTERIALFLEARRALAPGGRIVLAEHLRDAANYAAYGPGAWHFQARATWQQDWSAAGLRLLDELAVTPFVRVWSLSKP